MEEQQSLGEEFLRSLQEAGGQKFLRQYRYRLTQFLAFLSLEDLRLTGLRAKEALAYQKWLLEQRTKRGELYSKLTVIGHMDTAKEFCTFLKKKGLLIANPFKEVKRLRATRKLPRNLLKEHELALFLEKLARFNEEADLREKLSRYKLHVMAELMYATGLRLEELTLLKPADLDLANSRIDVQEGKGGLSRVVFLNEYSREVLRLYVERMRALTFNDFNKRNSELLFGVRVGWLTHSMNRLLKKIASELGLPSQTSHCFRHNFGFHLLRAGCNIRYIQQLLGHRRLKTTELYTKVEKEDLKLVLQKYHPRRFGRSSEEGEA